MTSGIFLPPPHNNATPPVLYWLSGLICNDENFTTKAGAQRTVTGLDTVLAMLDASPHGEQVADDDGYDLDQGTEFYLNATQRSWATHFHMYDHLRDEPPALIQSQFNIGDRCTINGHSMGDYSTLIMALKNPGRYTSVPALAPIVNPCRVPWGKKAFSAYLGEDRTQQAEWDSCALMLASKPAGVIPTLANQGGSGQFLADQLQPTVLVETAYQTVWPVTPRIRPGYDHNYYLIVLFIEDHLRSYAQYLLKWFLSRGRKPPSSPHHSLTLPPFLFPHYLTD